MKTYQKVMGVALTLGLLAAPAYAVVESGTAPARELTLADFQRSAGKPTQAWEQYRQYKHRLKNPAPQPTLDASRMRAEKGELTLADFQQTNPKPWIAAEQYKQYKYRQEHPIKQESYVAPAFTSSGKPSVDWWKARQLKG
jgi:hypothetical protein